VGIDFSEIDRWSEEGKDVSRINVRGARGAERAGTEGETQAVAMPGQRALGAMAEAARRAREAGPRTAQVPVVVDPPEVRAAPPHEERRVSGRRVWRDLVRGGPRANAGAPPDGDRRERRLKLSVATLGGVVLVAAVALAFSLGTHQHPTPGPTGAPSGSPSSTPTSPSSGRGDGAKQSTTTSPASLAVGGVGVVSSLSPSSGGAGQSVVVSGSNFISANGQIVAEFGGQVTATSCPDQSTCTVKVPDLGPTPRSVPFTITTQSGTSKAMTFRYS
jgi:hypothetical protein